MKNIKNEVAIPRKLKAIDVLFSDPKIFEALSRVNVFVVDHDPYGHRISTSMMSDEDVAAQPSHNPFKWLDYVHPDDRAEVRQVWETVIHGKQDVFEAEYRFLVNGEYRWIANKGTMAYRGVNGQPELYVAVDRDITEERRLRRLLEEERARLSQLIIRDDFLNVPNRRYLETKQSEFFPTDGQTPLAVFVLDIDNFKELNTRLTHHGGDGVLQAVVNKVQACVRDIDILVRYGGDEFVLILPKATIKFAHNTAQSVLKAVMEIDLPTLNDGTLVSVSIGFVHGCPTDDQNFWDYFEEADTLLLAAKKRGKAQIHSKFF
tara:strand:- start:190 stop:1146 length:957 start_codon:yes stop_codon:yes gene_type:complete